MDNEQLPKGYKNTEVGVIPEDWEVKAIGKYTDVTSGGTPSTLIREYWDGPIRWMNSGELNLKIVYEVENRITELGLNESATKLVPKNCVLIGLAGQGKTRGTVAINKVELCTNQSIAAILPSDEVFYEYLYYNLDSRYFELRGLSTGDGGRGGLNLTIIKNLLISLPPTKAEQTAIATALSDADALINSLEKLIAKKRNIKQGAMQQLLKPKDGWEVKKLGEIAEIYQPQTISQDVFVEDGYLVYGANGVIGKFHLFNHETWQTTITCRGSTCGTVNRTIDKSWITGNAMVMNVDENRNIDKLFFYYILTKQDFSQCITGSGQPQIVRSPLFDFTISIPKSKEKQKEIAFILSDMDAEINALETKLEKYKKVKLGMMQNLLTGKIRLV